ncbi:MAG: hypothetical protein AB1403_06640 [Candidatus Riflebacteria bacterium]
MKKLLLALILLLAVGGTVMAQSSSYLDSVYQSQNVQMQEEQSEETDPIEALKNEIYETYQVEMVEDAAVNRWTKSWLQVVKSVLAALPQEFRSATKMITLDPTFMPYEVKYNGFDEREGEILIGYGAIYPSGVYLNKFKAKYNRLPTESEKQARFKSILVRGMTYAFQQANPETAKKWGQVYTAGTINTKLHGPGQDKNMIVSPVMSLAMVDMAFSVALYCSAGSELKSKASERYNFIKENVMGGKTVSGWGNVSVDDDGGTGNNGGGTVETPGTRPPPVIPDGDYLPVVTEADVGTAAATIPQDQQKAPEELKSDIVEVFEVMPKFFSTCTEAIVYYPTTDTEAAFSSEGFIFITQNSWFAPSFVALDPESRSNRFKAYLVVEMTKRFLFFHPEVTKKWKETFSPNQTTFDTYVDLCEATLLYFQNPQWLKDLNAERYNFIKSELMKGTEFD